MGSTSGIAPNRWTGPYVTYDDNTHNMKPDKTYQRGDLPAPYVNQDLWRGFSAGTDG